MPTYTVTTANIHLSQEHKAAIAEIITAAHHECTGAPRYFAQVFFKKTNDGDHFIGGKPNKDPHVFVLGQIRAGRSAEKKEAIIEGIIANTTKLLGIDQADMWSYIQDIDANQMAEFGRILPAPGDEAAWQSGMSEAKLAHLSKAGVDV